MGQDKGGKESSGHETLGFAEFLSRAPSPKEKNEDRPHLVVVEPGKEPYVVFVTRNPTVVGRSANADLVLADTSVSDFHARLIKHSFGYTIEDMGSAEGTFLQNRRVSHARIVNGDAFRLGTTTFTFQGEAASSIPGNRRKTKPLSALSVQNKSTALTPSAGPQSIIDQRPPIRRVPTPAAAPRAIAGKNQEHADGEQSIEDLVLKLLRAYRFLARNALIVSVFLVLGTALGAASFRFVPPVQGAFSLITLHAATKANPIDPDSRPAPEEKKQYFAGTIDVLTSTSAVQSTLIALGIPQPGPGLAEAVIARMKVVPRGTDSYLATIKPNLFDRGGLDPVLFLATHIQTYIDLEIAKGLKGYVAEVEFLRSQTEAADKAVKRVSDELVKFREQNVDQLLAQGSVQAGSQLETRRIDLAGEIHRLQGELGGIRSQLARGSALQQAKAQSNQPYRDRVARTTQQIAELRAQGYADGHPDIQRLLAEQRDIEHMVDNKLAAKPTESDIKQNTAYDALRAQADQLESRIRAAYTERGFVETNLRNIRKVSALSPEINAKVDELIQMKDETTKQYSLLFDRLKKAEIRLELERVSATSRYEIDIPARLEAPPGKKVLATRIFIGTGIGAGMAAVLLLLRALRDIFRRVSQNANLTILLVVALVGLFNQGCGHPGAFIWVADLPSKTDGEPVIQPRDTILVEVQKQPALSGEFVIRDDGHFLQPVIGSIRVADLTPRQAAIKISVLLKDVVVNPVVSVWVTKVPPIRVSVVGEVRNVGTYELGRNRNLLTALAAAGWVTDFASKDGIFVIRADNSRIRFRLHDIKTSAPATAAFRLNDADVIVVE
jgi:polysaccharide export outer membrane protein